MHFDKVAEARDSFKAMLDAAQAGTPVTVNRDGRKTAVVDAERLAYFLGRIVPRPEMFHGEGSWWFVIPGLPISADGPTLDEALDDLISALREYAEDWVNDLRTAPNHVNNWGLVQFTELSTDEQLRAWVTGGAAEQ